MKIIKRIPRVDWLVRVNNDIYPCWQGKIMDIEGNVIFEGDYIPRAINNTIYLNSDFELFKLIDGKVRTFCNIKASYICDIAEDDFLCFRPKGDGVFRWKNSKILWEKEIPNQPETSLLSRSLLFFKTPRDFPAKKTLIRIDLETGEEMWTYKVDREEMALRGGIYAYENILTIIEDYADIMQIKKEVTMIALDLDTGEVLWKREVSLRYAEQQGHMLYSFSATFFGNNTYSEVDMLTGETFSKTFEDLKVDTVGQLGTIDGNYLYFPDSHNRTLGVIDIRTRELVEVFPLGVKKYVTFDKPIITDDKIYIHDSMQVLHILDKYKE